jgi:alpha-glucosidase
LPQPTWFDGYAVDVEDADPTSTLNLYRHALALRRQWQTDETLAWADAPAGVLHAVRPNGWHCVFNTTTEPVPLPLGQVLLTTQPLDDATIPGETAVWLKV